MHVDVFFTRHEFTRANRDGLDYPIIVIDVLRASSTLIQALSVGARPIYIISTPMEAFKLKEKLGDAVLLCGEREGLIIDGFDMGNSPLEYTRQRVGGRPLIFCSSNGSQTLLAAAKKSSNVLLGGFVNLSALVERIIKYDRVDIICSGKLGRYCNEDVFCAGMIIQTLINKEAKPVMDSDSATAANWLFERYLSDPRDALELSEHPVYLSMELNYTEDVAFCTNLDSHSVVPFFKDGVLSL